MLCGERENSEEQVVATCRCCFGDGVWNGKTCPLCGGSGVRVVG